MSTLSRVIVLAALAASPVAEAMTLGPLVVQSHIGQPFQASIAVRGARGRVYAHIAPRAAFRAAGMTPPGRDTVYRCRVTGRAGHQRIVVTSGRPIEHPNIALLLVINSPHGSRVQEYRAALRPVLLPTMHVQSGIEPTMMASTDRVLSAPQEPTFPTPARSPYRAIGPIHPGESLLDAAGAMDPGHHNLGPLMEALVRANPEAFVDDNANGLRVGAILHRPAPSVVRALSPAHALRFLRAQYTAWTRIHAPHPVVTRRFTASQAVAVPVAHSAPLAPKPLLTAPVVAHKPRLQQKLDQQAAVTPGASAVPLSLTGAAQSPARPIPEADDTRSPTPALSVATLAVTGVTGHPVPVDTRPTPTSSVSATPANPPDAAYDGIPIHQLADLAILVIAVLGVRQFIRQRRTGGGFLRSPLANLFARPQGDAVQAPSTPAAPASAPASAAVDTTRIPSYGVSATHTAPTPTPSENGPPCPPSAGASLVVTVAYRDDQILRLDLARAYVDLGEIAVAREILAQVRAGLEGMHKPALDDRTDG